MGDAFSNPLTHLHPIFSHFPIVLLIASVALDLLARRQVEYRSSAWLALLVGTAGAVASTITGLIDHLPYEETPQIALIEPHQYLAFATTALFAVLTFWRWRVRRRGRDVERSGLYLGVALAGLAILLITGLTGGTLVYEHGIGVERLAR